MSTCRGWIGLGIMSLLVAASAGGATPPDGPLTLDKAIEAARAANVRLPVAALDVQIDEQTRLEAAAVQRVQLALAGDFVYAPPNGYDPVVTNAGEERLQLSASKLLYDGGAASAGVRQAAAQREVAAARYRLAVRDVDLEVRVRFSELIAADREIEARTEGLERLRGYESLLESRQRAGQAVAGDLLRTRVEVTSAQADLIAAEARRDGARMALNQVMGRDPATLVAPAPLPPPLPVAAASPSQPQSVPEVAAARHQVEAASASLDIARAERKPHLGLLADAGLWGSDTSHAVPPDFVAAHPGATFGDRLRRDLGYSMSVAISWPLTDSGGIRARIARAELAVKQAQQSERATESEAAFELDRARQAMGNAYRQYRLLAGATPAARDAYLEAESRYRGGAASSLEVLDAFAKSIDTAVRAADAELAYRAAEALALRWGGQP
jgi:outer membrane protein TolC